MTTIRVSDALKTKLESIRDDEEHSSFDSTLRSLVHNYEYPIAPNGLADAFDRDALAMLNRFNLEGVATPLPTALEDYFGPPVRGDLTHKFRVYMGGWWLSSPKAVQRAYTLPHFDAYGAGGSFLFKFHTAADLPVQSTVNGGMDGDHWVLVEQADYEDAVLQVLDADGVEFLAPVGGVPECDEEDMPPFGGYGAEGRSYWNHDDHEPEHVPEWHEMQTVAEYIGEMLPYLQQREQQHSEQIEQERREDKQEFINKLVEHGVEEAADLDPDAVEGSDLLDMIPDGDREAFENEDGNLSIPGGQVSMLNMTLPVEKAVEYHVYAPKDVVAGDDNGKESYTAADLIERGHEMDLPVPVLPPANDIEILFRAMYADTFEVNPHGFDEDEWVDRALDEAGVVRAEH